MLQRQRRRADGVTVVVRVHHDQVPFAQQGQVAVKAAFRNLKLIAKLLYGYWRWGDGDLHHDHHQAFGSAALLGIEHGYHL